MTAPDWLHGAAGLPDGLILAWLAFAGLLLGSFLNVVIHRLPRGASLLGPRSQCPSCGSFVRARDNVPVLGWLMLRGRCRDCGEGISARYPLVEILGAVCVTTAVWLSADAAEAALRAALLLALVAVFFIDLDHRLILDVMTLPGVAIGLAVAPLVGTSRTDALIGAAAGYVLLEGLRLGWRAWRGEDGLGGGDVKLAAWLGAWLGWQGVALTFLLGSLLGIVVGGVLIARGRADGRTALPYGVFLAPAAAVSTLQGPAIWAWYLGLGA